MLSTIRNQLASGFEGDLTIYHINVLNYYVRLRGFMSCAQATIAAHCRPSTCCCSKLIYSCAPQSHPPMILSFFHPLLFYLFFLWLFPHFPKPKPSPIFLCCVWFSRQARVFFLFFFWNLCADEAVFTLDQQRAMYLQRLCHHPIRETEKH